MFIMLYKKKNLYIISQSWKVIQAKTLFGEKILYWISEQIYCELSEYQELFRSELERLGKDIWCLSMVIEQKILDLNRGSELV